MSAALRVLLVSANTEKLPDPVFPIGAAYMAAVAERAGHTVDTLDLCFLDDGPAALRGALADFQPDVVGFSLRNLDSSAYPQNTSYVDDYRVLIETTRAHSDATVILGGAGFTVMPATLLALLDADVGVVGEGETSFPWVLERLAQGTALCSDAAFTCESVGRHTMVKSVVRIRQLDEIGLPLRRRFDVDRYHELGGALNLQTKRGCAFECTFCSYPLIEGAKIRMRSPRSVVDEIQEAYEELRVRHWFFVDNIFNVPIAHAKEICHELIERDLSIEWSGYLNPKFVDAELCTLMARSGCKAIEFGTDTGAPSMIQSLKKEFDVEDLRRTSRLCHDSGLRFCHSLIFGGPGETAASVQQTLDLMEETQPTAVIAMTGIRILPGTGMVDIAVRDAQIDPDDDLVYPRFYVSPNLADDLVDRIEAHARRRPNWIVPGLGIKTNISVLRKLRERKIKGQLWRLLR